MKSLKTYISEKLIINKHLEKQIPEPNDLTLDDVPKKYKNIRDEWLNDLNQTFTKRCYNKDGKPTNWFLWWMMLCVYGPMTRKETLKKLGWAENSYPKSWADMTDANIISYDTKLRKSVPMPMKEWKCWNLG